MLAATGDYVADSVLAVSHGALRRISAIDWVITNPPYP
jgi:hypothetical protein